RRSVLDQQLQRSDHQAVGREEVFTQRGARGLTARCHTTELGLPLAAGSPE
ncbi:hypothetical protein M9458_048182, partial [Cirrhinus mrigala]